MATPIPALSISRSLWEQLPAQPAPGRVLAVFERSCLLSPHDGDPLSLVLPDLGDGPLNVVVETGKDAFAGVEPGVAARLSRTGVQAGPLAVDLAAARAWEPRPAWAALRARLEGVTQRSTEETQRDTERSRKDARRPSSVNLCAFSVPLCVENPSGSLLALFYDGEDVRCEAQARVLHTARRAAGALAAGWAGDADALRRGARRLAGLGGGLTPAGDDFLAGLMLRAWLAHPAPEGFCRLVVEAAAPRTTALSAAFLRAAARGECGAAWHALLAALAGGGPASLDEAARGVLAHGHTSGADMLAGFLWWPD